MAGKWVGECTLTFVEEYSKHPCLWNPENSAYKNKESRRRALQKMVDIMNIPGFDILAAKKKLRIIRSTYWNECSKIAKSLKSDDTSKGVYKPKITWFDTADRFLRNVSHFGENNYTNIEAKERNSNGGEFDESVNLENISFVNVGHIKTEYDESMEIHNEPFQSFDEQNHEYPGIPENDSSHSHVRESVSPVSSPSQEPERKRIKTMSGVRSKDIVSAINRLETVLTSAADRRDEDLFDVFGKNVSDQLRQLPRRQAIMAQSKIQNLLIQEFLDFEDTMNTTPQEQPL